MKELSTQARAHLDALRSIDAPDPGAATRVWEAVSSRAAAGELGPELPADGGAIAGAGGATSIKSIALGVLVGAGVAITGAAALLPSDAPLAAAPALARLEQIEARSPDRIDAPAPIDPELEEAPLEIVDEEVAAAPTERPPRARAVTRVAAPRASEPAPVGDPVAEEVALLAEARSALGAGDAARAIGVLGRHRKRFPEGLLARERDVSWITALCVLGRVDEARTKASSFLRAHGSSPHAAKVRASCGGTND